MDRTRFDADVAGVAALEQPLRRDLYAHLVNRGDWVTRDEAAAVLGLPRSVAAFHLDKLTDAGLLHVRYERPSGRSGPGAGRPAKAYRRSDKEISVSLPERHYDLAGTVLADAVHEATSSGRPVTDAVTTSAHAAGNEVGTAVRAQLPRRCSATVLRQATIDALEQLGYEPRELDGDVALANCPFHVLAERHPALVCGMNLDLIGGLVEGLGADDRLVPRLAPAENMCCVRVGRRHKPAAESAGKSSGKAAR
jgi:predicted ArsR family transcriptional regulator